MLKKIATLTIAATVTAAATGSLAAQTAEGQITKLNENIAGYMSDNIPFLASLGLNDATGSSTGFPFITAGITGGLALFDDPTGTLNSGLAESVNISNMPIAGGSLPMVYSPSAFGRVGIPGTSFDVGIKFGFPVDITYENVTLKNTSFGGDLRYSLMEQGLLLPGVSFAAGFDYSSGEISYSDSAQYGTYDGTNPLNVKYTSKAEWGITNLNATAKVGYDILFLSMMGGLQVYTPIGSSKVTYTGTINGTSKTIESESDASGLKAKMMLGLYFRLPLTRIGAQYDREFNSGASAISGVAQFVF